MEEFDLSKESELSLKKGSSKKVILSLVIFGAIIVFIVMFLDFDEDGLSNISEIIVHDTDYLELDTDRDGLDDKYELNNNLNPRSNDSDFDGLSDGQEVKYVLSDPLIADTDNDSLSDGIEVKTLYTNPLVADSDDDNLSDYYETAISLTNPNKADTDKDDLTDGDEINIYQTNPLMSDSDQDLLSDSQEVFEYLTEPNMFDSDGDSLGDGYEVYTILSNPLIADTDNDGIDDDVDINPTEDVQIVIEFGFEGYLGDSFSGPDSYFIFYISHEDPVGYYLTTQTYVDTYSKSLDSSGSFSYDWNDSSELIYIIISGYDSDTWNSDERLDLGGPDTSDISIQLTYDSITNHWAMDYISSYGADQDASFNEGYPCEFSIRVSVASIN
jgi:hypothetical protein|tara:strand:+ start:2207 stop:3361 length:1155 start_codon:yes stop_codon:yes gene_type:complete